MEAVVHYVLAVLEGGMSGGLFYCAGQEKDKKRKVLLYIASALSFAMSLLDSLEGGRAWKELKAAKAAAAEEADFADEDEGEADDE